MNVKTKYEFQRRKRWSFRGSNPGPFACKANVITTTLNGHSLNLFFFARLIPHTFFNISVFQRIISSFLYFSFLTSLFVQFHDYFTFPLSVLRIFLFFTFSNSSKFLVQSDHSTCQGILYYYANCLIILSFWRIKIRNQQIDFS